MSLLMRRARTITAWILLIGSIVMWPVSMKTFAKDEPPLVLSLSFLAIVIEAASLLTASQVHEEQAEQSGDRPTGRSHAWRLEEQHPTRQAPRRLAQRGPAGRAREEP